MNNLKNFFEFICYTKKYNIICEKATEIVYHFTKLDNLLSIINSNRLQLDNCEETEKYKYFASLTRQKNSHTGYPVIFSESKKPLNYCRIQFDGNELNMNQKLSIHPFNYMKLLNSKQDYNQNDYSKKFNVQSEDRILSKNRFIENILKYISRIDIMINVKNDNVISDIENILDNEWQSKIYIL